MKIKWKIDYANNIATSRLIDVSFVALGEERDIYDGEWYDEESKETNPEALKAFADAVVEISQGITSKWIRSGAFTKDDCLFAVFILRIHNDLLNEIMHEDNENVMGDSRRDITHFYTQLSEQLDMNKIMQG